MSSYVFGGRVGTGSFSSCPWSGFGFSLLGAVGCSTLLGNSNPVSSEGEGNSGDVFFMGSSMSIRRLGVSPSEPAVSELPGCEAVS